MIFRIVFVIVLVFASFYLFSNENLEKVKNIKLFEQNKNPSPVIYKQTQSSTKSTGLIFNENMSFCQYYSDFKNCKE